MPSTPSYVKAQSTIKQSKTDICTDTLTAKSTSKPISSTAFTSPQLPIIKDLGFEKGTANTGWEWGGADYNNSQNAGPPSRLDTIPKNSTSPPSPALGKNALNVTVMTDDCVHRGARAEVWLNSIPLVDPNTHQGMNSLFQPSNDTWFHWYVFIPNTTKISNTWHIVTQWHGVNDFLSLCHKRNGDAFKCSIVPEGFNLRNFSGSRDNPTLAVGPTLEFGIFNSTDANPDPTDPNAMDHYGTREILWSTWNQTTHKTSFMPNHWYDILLHIVWDTCHKYTNDGKCDQNNGSNGAAEMWVDRKKVFSIDNHETMATVFDPTKPDNIGQPDLTFFRQGLYHCTSDGKPNACKNQSNPVPPPGPMSIYYDGTAIALCDNPKVNNFHPNVNSNNNTKPGDCKLGNPYESIKNPNNLK